MTGRINALIVVLARDLPDDAAQAKSLIEAIKQLRGVLSVEPHAADPDLNERIAELRVRNELYEKLLDVIYPPKKAES